MRVVICGGGVIGACTAYFLARSGLDVTVIERTGVACAASGAVISHRIGTPDTTASVHPRKFTAAMMRAAAFGPEAVIVDAAQ